MSENISENQILVVDDSRVIRRAAVKILQKDFDIVEAEDGEAAWHELQNNPKISAVFSDLGMPNMDGFQLLEAIRNADDEALAKIPVIIITGAEETDGTKEKVLELGATDFITKPFDSVSLKSRASAHINYRNEVQSLEKRVALDKLTGLCVEASFKQQADQVVAYAKRHCAEVSIVYFDIDRFSEIFIKHGKAVAGQIVAKVASLVSEGKRTEDIAARLGVSKFALLLPSSDLQGAELVVSRICQRVSRLKLKLGSEEFKIQFSSGVTSTALDNEIETDDLLKQAESALQTAISEGGGKIICYQTGKEISHGGEEKITYKDEDINLEELLKWMSNQCSDINNEQLAAAMRKVMPLIAAADSRLKLGLSKVLAHLKKRLYD